MLYIAVVYCLVLGEIIKESGTYKRFWEHQAAKPEFHNFKDRFKSRFESGFVIYVKCCAKCVKNYLCRCIGRRVTAILLREKNLGPNVVYCRLGTKSR